MGAISRLNRDLVWGARNTCGFASRWQLIRDFLWSRLRRGNVIDGSFDRKVRLKDGACLIYRLNRADLYAIHEIFVDGEYDLRGLECPQVVVDLGANIGLASVYLAKRYGAYVVAVEPSAENARVARLNLTENNIRGEVIEAAVGSTDGNGAFLRGPAATCGRVDFKDEFDADGRAREFAVSVPVLSMISILGHLPRDARVNLLKVDIEGGEEELLRGDISWLERVDMIVIEFHPTLIDYTTTVSKLESAGFVRRSRVELVRTTVEIFARVDAGKAAEPSPCVN